MKLGAHMSQVTEPFNIKLLDNKRARLGNLLPVTSTDIMDKNNEFHPQGLYSVPIFGRVGEKMRMQRHSFIDTQTLFIHPKLCLDMFRLKNIYQDIMTGTAYAVFNKQTKDFERSNVIDGETGYGFFMSHWNELSPERNQSVERNDRITLLMNNKVAGLYRYFTVLPAGLRDLKYTEDGHMEEDELNQLYRTIIRLSNNMTYSEKHISDKSLDKARWAIQSTVNDVYLHLENFIKGKRGFALDKWANRNIANGTRSVITASDVSSEDSKSVSALSIKNTVVGIYQFSKAAPYKAIYRLNNGIAAGMISALPGKVSLLNKKTLLPELVQLSPRWRERWGTSEGMEKLLNDFSSRRMRGEPLELDGHYLALIWKDYHKGLFQIYYSIEDVPKDRIRQTKPITWGEWLYIDVEPMSKESIAYITRYPISGIGSIYPSVPYIRTTEKAYEMKRENEEYTYPQFPGETGVWYDSMAVAPQHLDMLGGDHDGDTCSFNLVVSDEAVKEGKDYLNSKGAYLKPSGGLYYGVRSRYTTNDVLVAMTIGMEKLKTK